MICLASRATALIGFCAARWSGASETRDGSTERRPGRCTTTSTGVSGPARPRAQYQVGNSQMTPPGGQQRELRTDRAPGAQDSAGTSYKRPRGHWNAVGSRDERWSGKHELPRDLPTVSSGMHDLGGTRRHANQDSQSQQVGGSTSSGGRPRDGIKLWACPVCGTRGVGGRCPVEARGEMGTSGDWKKSGCR